MRFSYFGMCEQRAQVKQTTSHHLGCVYSAPHRFFSLFLFFKICIYNTLAHTSTLLCLLLINYSRMPHRHIKWCDFFSSSAVALLFSVIPGSAFFSVRFCCCSFLILSPFSHHLRFAFYCFFSLFGECVCFILHFNGVIEFFCCSSSLFSNSTHYGCFYTY